MSDDRLFTIDQLRAIMPRCPDVATWHDALTEAMVRYDIRTPARIAAFLAQIAHESSDCRRVEESLNYSATRLMQVWPSRFPSLHQAEAVARQPEAIANLVYGNRLGNGPPESGDGWRYRGRGLLQLTGRANYRMAGDALGLDLEQQPESVREPRIAALTAAQFWASRGLNILADDMSGDDRNADFRRITATINGGQQGLIDRQRNWARARRALGLGN